MNVARLILTITFGGLTLYFALLLGRDLNSGVRSVEDRCVNKPR